ncbi:PTS transporter subunit IIC [Mollicutes bacterium LVI A0039]|nr:PTS transporter subunit IIC [Mollicutes bacterium LVI A0039]
MQGFIELINNLFQPLINLGAGPMMIVFITLIGLVFKVKFSKALESGVRLAVAIAGMGAVIGLIVQLMQPALEAMVENTGISLSVQDVGWAPVAGATWASPLTLVFLFVYLIINGVMLVLNKTKTLDVDIWNIWGTGFTALMVMALTGNIFLTVLFVVVQTVLKLRNSDIMKPAINRILGTDDMNPTTTTHIMFLINPILFALNQVLDLIPGLDKVDFDAKKLNAKAGFLGSKISIGIIVGIIIGVLGRLSFGDIITMAIGMGMCLELFAVVGGWFTTAMNPLSKGIAEFMTKRFGADKKLYIGIDWPFLASRAELWAVANILAVVFLFIALFLPGNEVLPLASIIALCLAAPLLVITEGKMLRMLIIGTLALPLFLWSSTLLAEIITQMAVSTGAVDIAEGTLISNASGEAPVFRMITYFISDGFANGGRSLIMGVSGAIIYSGLWLNYEVGMKKKNKKLSGE